MSQEISFKINVDASGLTTAAQAVDTLKSKLQDVGSGSVTALKNALDGVKDSAQPAANSVAALRDRISELKSMRDSVDINSKAFEDLQGRVKVTQTQLKEITQEAKGLSNEQLVRGATRIGEGIAGSFVLAKLAIASYTGSEAAAAAAQKTAENAIIAVLAARRVVEGYLAAVQLARLAIAKLSVTVTQEDAATSLEDAGAKQVQAGATQEAAVSQEELNTAILANPYVIAAAALVVIIGAIAIFAIGAAEAAIQQENLTRKIDQAEASAARVKLLSDAQKEYLKTIGASQATLESYSRQQLERDGAALESVSKLRKAKADAAAEEDLRAFKFKTLLGIGGQPISEETGKLYKASADAAAAFEKFKIDLKTALAGGANALKADVDAANKAAIESEKEGLQKRLDLRKQEYDAKRRDAVADLALAKKQQDDLFALGKNTAAIQLTPDIQAKQRILDEEAAQFNRSNQEDRLQSKVNEKKLVYETAVLEHASAEEQEDDLRALQQAQKAYNDEKFSKNDSENRAARVKQEKADAIAILDLRKNLLIQEQQLDLEAQTNAVRGNASAVYQVQYDAAKKAFEADTALLDEKFSRDLVGQEEYDKQTLDNQTRLFDRTEAANRAFFAQSLSDTHTYYEAEIATTTVGTEARREAVEKGLESIRALEQTADKSQLELDKARLNAAETFQEEQLVSEGASEEAILKLRTSNEEAKLQLTLNYNNKQLAADRKLQLEKAANLKAYIAEQANPGITDAKSDVTEARGNPIALATAQFALLKKQRDKDVADTKIDENNKVISHEQATARLREIDVNYVKAKEDVVRQTAQTIISVGESVVSGLENLAQQQIDNDKQISDNKIASINAARDVQLAALDAEYNRLKAHNSRVSVLDEQHAKKTAQINAEAKAKTDAIKLDQFNKQKEADAERAEIDGLVGAARALTDYIFPYSLIPAGLALAFGELQAQNIRSKAAPTFAVGGLVTGPGTGTSDSIVARLSAGESVINARSTARYAPILSQINQAEGGRAFASGGVAGSGDSSPIRLHPDDIAAIAKTINDKKVYVVESEITSAQATIAQIKQEAKF